MHGRHPALAEERLRFPAQRIALTLLALLVIVFTALASSAHADPSFPELTGRVVDQANLISPEEEVVLTQKLEQLQVDTGDQLVVVTLESLQGYEIEEYGYQLGRHWGIGAKENDGGVLLIVAPAERKVRIEVGYGLEPILTDAFSALVIQNEILPAFRAGAMERGILQGTDAVIAQLRLDPQEAAARAAAVEAKSASFPWGTIITILVIFFFLMLIFGGGGRGRRRRSSAGPVVWTSGSSSGSSWSGGGSSWGGGGGGFSGGGGSFGGGGASGGW